MNIHTVQFSHILEASDLESLRYFLSHTAFVISHKSEPVENLLNVLWYLPANSPVIIVSNCPESEWEYLSLTLENRLTHHQKIYLVHQKDASIARLFQRCGVYQILGEDGKVVNGKGEGMYIGTLCAYLLGYVRWVVFYDADNFVPSALLEYTMAMSKLFTATPLPSSCSECDTIIVRDTIQELPALHNVRVCWSSKPQLNGKDMQTKVMGRCTSVVSPICNDLLEGWFGMRDHTLRTSNAGEQGLTMEAASTLRFSSGYSVETFQLLDLFYHAINGQGSARGIVLQQYLSKSPHFHEKRGDEHIKKMIEQSLGSFFHFESALPANVRRSLEQAYDQFQLELIYPTLYPALRDLPLEQERILMKRFALFADEDDPEYLACALL
ncbi:MAG TPA: mannosyl-3-phosphoglycerate synthase [Ktedonobacteraceae bacterium]|nr:mannosyl-3-phosphoglycerate synthase [Ktedonobacteraceae bacterium]